LLHFDIDIKQSKRTAIFVKTLTMKVTKTERCEDCPYRCDIYESVIRSGNSASAIDPIQASFRKHGKICKQGSPVTHALNLVKGTAKLYIEGINGHDIILYLMKPPAYIGLLSFFESAEYSYSVVALEDCRVCMVDLALLKQLYLQDHDLLLKLNKAFGRSVSLIMKKIITLNQKNIRGRVAESLLYLADFYGTMHYQLPITRKELGMLSGISEENTVRLLTEFRNEQIIRVEGREVEILDLRMLSKISDLG
jgi:CRP/FNR family transcriptional regulator